MSFSEFKNIAEVQQLYNIKYQEESFIDAKELALSKAFLEDFEFNKANINLFTSEASRSELIISPLLREIYKRHYDKYSFWIQKSISFDKLLTGTPDYIFSKKSALGKTVLEKPLLIVIEAKKNDFEQGWGQCLAELVALQKINQDSEHVVYGVVTDGNLWQFGCLTEDVFCQNPENFTIDKLEKLFGALECLAKLAEQQV